MTGHVNHDRAGQDQNVIFPLGDLHTVGVAPGKPLLRDGGPVAGLPPEFVFVIGEITPCLQIVRARNVHREPAMEEGEQLLLDHREQSIVAVD
jgi:hypothetical protein